MPKKPFRAVTSLFNRSNTSTVQEEHHQEQHWKLDASDVGGSLVGLDDANLRGQLKMIDLTVEDLRIIRSIQPLVMEHIDEIVASFYQTVVDVDKLRTIIMDNSTVERLRNTLRLHVIEMFNGEINPEFVQKRLKIAEVHQRIGLEPKWYMGAFQNLQNAFLDIIHQHVHNSAESLVIGKAVTKLLNFEQQLVLEAYEKKNTEQQERQYELVKKELKSKISIVSQELATLTEHTNASTQELVLSSHHVNVSVAHSTEKARESRMFAVTGAASLVELESRMESIQMSSRQMEQSVLQLKDVSKQIVGIAAIVGEISSQTKLLSLNASIEAARAGEQGAGFSVVANEVKKLSDDTSEAVRQIGALIQQTNQFTQQVVDSISEVQRQVLDGQAESMQTKQVFNHIVESLESGLSEIGKVEVEMKALAEAIAEVGEAATKVAGSAVELNHATQAY